MFYSIEWRKVLVLVPREIGKLLEHKSSNWFHVKNVVMLFTEQNGTQTECSHMGANNFKCLGSFFIYVFSQSVAILVTSDPLHVNMNQHGSQRIEFHEI
jgi:hypothetical protein